MRKLLTVAEMTLRELIRRKGVIALLLLFPLAFYLLRRGDYVGQSVRLLLLGVSWAVSTAALFATSASREIEPRLRLTGYRTSQLYLGRLLGLTALGLAVAIPFYLLVHFDAPNVRHGGTALAMVFSVAVAAPFGMLIGTVLPRELEGTLLLLITIGIQMLMDPDASWAPLTPLWSVRELGTYAVDHTDGGYLVRGIVHGIGFTLGLAVLVALVSGFRLRRRGHLRFGAVPH
ncbi:hypothetical protein [Micromonospora zhanjiangensis]|uniref:ABC-2 type transport system permease protein n=1 Tax=Micromonospora zhanjiangensis TaxID=1522057 RepID=A0ABV8KVW6_9ACTN